MLPNIEIIRSNNKIENITDYKNKIILVVNTATKCGFAPQFRELETIYQKYKDDDFIILAFPCNQFKNQEPLKNEKMESTCQLNFGVTFPMFKIIDVNGENEHPLFTWLKNEKRGLFTKNIKWNFTKFLIDSEGNVIKRYAPSYSPLKIEKDIVGLIHKNKKA